MLTLGDISTKNIVFYDPYVKDRCVDFCQRRAITLMPDLHDPHTIWRYNAESRDFKASPTPPESIADAQTPVFNANLASRFAESPLLLIQDQNCTAGVVHFSDYNCDKIAIACFSAFREWERTARTLLNELGFSDEDFARYLENHKNERWQLIAPQYRLRSSSASSAFAHADLLPFNAFLGGATGIKLKDSVTKIRNSVMHARGLVLNDPDAEHDLIFDLESFTTFFTCIQELMQSSRTLKNRLAIESENKYAA